MADAEEPVDFEASLTELESLVARMEAGDLTLEQSLAAFERGVRLTRMCQEALRSAELRIKALTQDGEEEDLGGGPANAPGPAGAASESRQA